MFRTARLLSLLLLAGLVSCTQYRLEGVWEITEISSLSDEGSASLDVLKGWNRGVVVEFRGDEAIVHTTLANITFDYDVEDAKVWLTPTNTTVAGIEIRREEGAPDIGLPYRFEDGLLILGDESTGSEIVLERMSKEDQAKFKDKADSREERDDKKAEREKRREERRKAREERREERQKD